MTPSTPSPSTRLPPAPYTFGGDEHLFVEISQEMSLPAFFKGMALTTALSQRRIAGVTEICPANASYLVRFHPGQCLVPGALRPGPDRAEPIARCARGHRGHGRRCRHGARYPHHRAAGALRRPVDP